MFRSAAPRIGRLRGVSRRWPLLLLAVLLGAAQADARIYQWIDAAGTRHYTDRAEEVPPAFRDQLELDEPVEEGGAGALLPRLELMLGGAGDDAPGEEAEDAAPAFESFEGFDAFDAQRLLDRFSGPALAGAVFGFLFVIGFVVAFCAFALLAACRLVGQESPGFKKAYGITLVQIFAGMVAAPGVVVALGQPDLQDVGAVVRWQALQAGVLLLVNAIVLRAMLCDSGGRALGLAVVVNLVLLGFGIVLGLAAVTCAGGAALLSA
jgi:hypothetical protein